MTLNISYIRVASPITRIFYPVVYAIDPRPVPWVGCRFNSRDPKGFFIKLGEVAGRTELPTEGKGCFIREVTVVKSTLTKEWGGRAQRVIIATSKNH